MTPNGARPLRVVDLTGPLAGNAGRLLVGLGADVVRVEHPEGRRALSLAEELHWHAGKRIIRTGELAVVDELVADADIVVESGARRDLVGLVQSPRHGDGLSRWPAAVHVIVTPFGLTGPKAEWLVDDLVLAAASGMAWLGGRPDGQPKPPPREQAYQLAGAHAAIAALLGIHARDRTGHGQLLEISAQEATVASLETGAISWIHARSFPRRSGGVYEHVAHRIFQTADGWVAGGHSGSDRMWTGLLTWMDELGLAEDLTDEIWSDPEYRWRNRPRVDDVVGRFAAAQKTADLAAEARRRALPWAEVATAADLLVNPQLLERGYELTITRPHRQPVRDVGFPFVTPARTRPVTLSAPAEVAVVDPLWAHPRRRPALREWTVGTDVSDGSLAGLRVLDLTWVLAGPYATRQLAEHGAEVIKVESSHRQDPTRFAPSMRLRPGASFDDSGYFINFNRDKRSIAVNMRDQRGVDVARMLSRHCHVIIENFAPGVLERWELDYESLRAEHPDVIVVSMAGVGRTGPWRKAVTFADTLAAMSGLSNETSDPGGRPQGLTFGLGDIVAANAAVTAVLDLLNRGEGGSVDLSQLEAMAAAMGTAVLDEQLGERPSYADVEHPNRHPAFVPHGLYPASGDDRWLALAVPDEATWARLVGCIDTLAPYLGADSDGRRAEEGAIDDLITRWSSERDGDAAAVRLQAADVPAAAVATGQDLVDRDEHLAWRNFFPTLTHPIAGPVRHEGIVVRATGTPGRSTTSAPLLGQDTDAVLHDIIGLTAEQVAELRAAGVLQ